MGKLTFVKEKHIFYLILMVHLWPCFESTFFVSMDGAAHLYNARLIESLWNGNTFIEQFFIFNPEPVPNWTSHFLMAIGLKFLSPILVEKFIILLFLLGLPLSFRWLIKVIKPKSTGLIYLIFPFTYSFVFALGFYNFCLALIPMFCALAIWMKDSGKPSWKRLLLLSGLMMLTFLSHVLVFACLGLAFASYFIIEYIFFTFVRDINKKESISQLSKKLLAFSLALIPSGLLFLNYLFKRPESLNPEYIESSKLLSDLVHIRSNISYNLGMESNYTFALFWVLALVVFIVILFKWKGYLENVQRSKGDFLLLTAGFMLVMYFLLPNSDRGAGIISVRMLWLFYLFLIAWIGTQRVKPKVALVISIVVLSLYVPRFAYYAKIQRNQNKEIKAIVQTAESLPKNSVIYPINTSANWLSGHFSNYLGILKPQVILENYEAGTGYFPLNWNPEKPDFRTGLSLNNCFNFTQDENALFIDYLFVNGKREELKDSCLINKLEVLELDGKLFKEFEYFRIYKLK
jgi:hypothetical protein